MWCSHIHGTCFWPVMLVLIYRPQTLEDVIASLQLKLRSESYVFNIRRECVLIDIINEPTMGDCHPLMNMKTWFVGEKGEDTGGLTRELWSLFSKEVESLCDGHIGRKIFRHDAVKIQVCNIETFQTTAT